MFELGNAEKNQLLDKHAENKYYADDFEIDVDNKNDTKVIIKDYIKNCSTCLDVGCGAGYLGEILKKHKKAKVYGIDSDIEALEIAKKKKCFDDLYRFSITERTGEDYDKFAKSGRKFDYIIFADVLEHVIDAADVLLFFMKYLKPHGELLVSLPNVAHFDIVRGIINQKFNYNHIGLLDNTHLRFYTKDSFSDFIEQINKIYGQDFAVTEIGETMAEPGYLCQYPNMYKLLGKDACVLQYVYAITVNNMRRGEPTMDRKTFDILEKELEELTKIREALKISYEEAERLRNRVAELEMAVDNIYKSTSWTATKPIRGVSRVVKMAIDKIDNKIEERQKNKVKNNLLKIVEKIEEHGVRVALATSEDEVTEKMVEKLVKEGYRNVLVDMPAGKSAPIFRKFGFRIVGLVDGMTEKDDRIKEGGRNINFYADYLVFSDNETKKKFEKEFDDVGARTKIMSLELSKLNVDEVVKCFKERQSSKFADLSVIVPNYNYEKYLPMRLESILRQTVKPREIILLDDNSKDESIVIAEPILKRAHEQYGIEYKIIKNKENKGCFSQWGKGFKEAKYDYVWIAEADDYERPNFVETVLSSFDDEDVVISYCKSCKIDSESVVADYDFNWYIEDLDKKKWTRDFVDGGPGFIKRYLADRNSIPNASAVIVRKSATKGIQKYLDNYQAIGDWFAYIYIIAQGKICYHADVLNGFRRHEKSIIAKEEQSPLFLREKDKIQKYLMDNFEVKI